MLRVLKKAVNLDSSLSNAWLLDDRSSNSKKVFKGVFKDCSLYWSSTTYAYYDPADAWAMGFDGGYATYYDKTHVSYVRCVRGGVNHTIDLPRTGQTTCYDSSGTEISCAGSGQDGAIQAGVAWPSPRFTDNSDQTISDNLTGLMWTKDAGTPTVGSCTGWTMPWSWQQALDYVACLNSNNYLGHNDWRLPNIDELSSLGNMGEANNNTWLNAQGFTNVQFLFWSSNTYAGSTGDAWWVQLGGAMGFVDKNYDLNHAWPVRTRGQAGIISLPKAGQTTSYAPGDDGAIQAGVAWPSPRFTVLTFLLKNRNNNSQSITRFN